MFCPGKSRTAFDPGFTDRLKKTQRSQHSHERGQEGSQTGREYLRVTGTQKICQSEQQSRDRFPEVAEFTLCKEDQKEGRGEDLHR